MDTTQQRTGRGYDIADASLREMVAHLNVIEASIDALERRAGLDLGARTKDILSRLELLAFSAARLHIADVSRVTDALQELVLAVHVRPHCDEEVRATLRHGVDILMLLTHDKMRRMQGYPAAELRGATDALVERVDRLIGTDVPSSRPAATAAGF